MPEVPLERELFSAALARVSYQLIVADYRRNRHAYEDPVTAIRMLSDRLWEQHFTALSIWVREAAYYVDRGVSVLQWRSATIDRARQAFFAYGGGEAR